MEEKLDIVDADDEVIDVASRDKTHTKGLRHRSVMFFVFNLDGKLLMTQRSENKRFYPSHWSVVLGGHVTSGLDYEEALEKEMEEEIGLVGYYEEIGSFAKETEEEKENVKLYIVEVDPEKVELIPTEFERARFIDLDELEKEREDKDMVPETDQVLRILRENWENI
ncbi:MAG: NUDIX domain-containing protein [Candidatus Thermoplasmatota archaeon]